jgi:hypothetical protein
MSLTPELTLGQPKAGKRRPGLRLTVEQLQPASSDPSPNSSSSYLGQSNTTRFREQIGNIVNGAENYNTASKPMEEETSLAASYLQSNDLKNQDMPVLREPPLPPTSQGFDSSTTTHHFMDITPEDLETISRLGEGAAGTVRKVLHTPTQLVMAKKVI